MSNKPQPVMGSVRQFWLIKNTGSEKFHSVEIRPPDMEHFEHIMQVTHVLEAAPTLELIDKLELVIKNLKPSLNIAFEDTNDLYYKNVEADIDQALTELRKWKDGLK